MTLSTIYSSFTPPPNCAITQFYSASSCQSCNAACTQGCVRNDVACNLCAVQQCAACVNFGTSCTSCVPNASGSPCACSSTYVWNSATSTCTSCPSYCSACSANQLNGCTSCITNYYSVQGVCINACPLGFTLSGSSCTLSNSFIFSLDLNNVISDTITDPQSGLVVSTGVNTNFYPTYDSTDPYATKERGYYFTGTSYMIIAGNSLVFAPLFTIYA